MNAIEVYLTNANGQDIDLLVCATRNGENISIKTITVVERSNYKNKRDTQVKWTELEDRGYDMKDFWEQIEDHI